MLNMTYMYFVCLFAPNFFIPKINAEIAIKSFNEAIVWYFSLYCCSLQICQCDYKYGSKNEFTNQHDTLDPLSMVL